MTDQHTSYRPPSPDFSSFQSPFPSSACSSSYTNSPLINRAPYDTSPFFAAHYSYSSAGSGAPQRYTPPSAVTNYDPDMARRSSRLTNVSDASPVAELEDTEPKDSYLATNVEVKTKFPVARIKRIMQADEDVGKVAQVTPIAVSKALELFMISLVTKAAKEARDRNSKRVTASHLKQAVVKDEVLDFLADIIAKVPDNATGRKHDDDGSDHNEGKKKRGGRRPKDDSE